MVVSGCIRGGESERACKWEYNVVVKGMLGCVSVC